MYFLDPLKIVLNLKPIKIYLGDEGGEMTILGNWDMTNMDSNGHEFLDLKQTLYAGRTCVIK